MSALTIDLTHQTAGNNPYVFVPRSTEAEFIKTEIHKRTREPIIARGVIQLTGSAGIGKTTFIQDSLLPMLREEFPTLPWVSLDFDTDNGHVNDRYECRRGRGHLLIDITTGLYGSIGAPLPKDFSEAQNRWETAEAKWSGCKSGSPAAEQELIDAEEELVGRFNLSAIPALIAPAERRPAVIILDTVEQVKDDFMGWIQSSLQGPTVQTGYVMWIMAGRFYVSARAFYLNRSYKQLPLAPFNERQIGQQLPDQADLAKELRRLSHGLPGAANRLAIAVREIEREQRRKLSDVELREQAIKQQLTGALDTYVKEKKLLGGLDGRANAAVRLLSVLRLFNYSILTQLLPGLLRSYLGPDVSADPEAIMQQLKESRLVDWHKERRAYVVEEPLRQILANLLQAGNLQIFDQINKEAFTLFNDWFRNVPEKRLDYLLEALFHRAVLDQLTTADPTAPPNIAPLKALLTEAVNTFYTDKNDDGLNELRERLSRDEDLMTMFTDEQQVELLAVFEPAKVSAEENP